MKGDILSKKERENEDNCFERKNIVGVARCLVRNGFSVIPLKFKDNELIPALPSWKEYQNKKMSSAFVEEFFLTAHGIAIVLGEISDCVVIDVDYPEKFNTFYSVELLKQKSGLVIKTKTDGCFHAYFKYYKEFNRYLNFLKNAGFEVKSNKTLCTFFSILPEFPYRIEKCEQLMPLPEELSDKIKGLLANRKISQQGLPENIGYILQKVYELTGHMPQQRNGTTWRGKCPAHDDEVPSLDITLLENGRVKFRCWAGCEEEEIRKALGLSEPETEETEKEAIAKRIIRSLQNNYSFWQDQVNEGYISLSPHEHLRIASEDFKDFLQELAYKKEGKLIHSQAMQAIIQFCKWLAKQSKEKYQTFKRVGIDEGLNFIEVDLKREDGKVLRISRDCICIDTPKLKFINNKSSLPMPLPDVNINPKEAWKDFFEIFNIHSREQLALIVSFMLKTFYPAGEYPILAILGNREGVGKTTLAKYIIKMLDPTITPIKPCPKSIDDLLVLAKNNFLLSFDNLTHIGDSLSDALCILSTGGSLAKRQLFTDSEAVEYYLKNPVILTSIYDILKNRDLRRRSLIVELEKPIKILPEKRLEEKFKKLQPKLYGYLSLCVQEALKEKVIELPLLDIADFCEWILKAEPIFFVSGLEFLRLIDQNRKETSRNILEGNLILQFVQKKLETQNVYETTPTEMFKELKNLYQNEFNLKNANSLGKEIKKIATDFEAFEIEVIFFRSKKERKLIFKKLGKSLVTLVTQSEVQKNQDLVGDNKDDENLNLMSPSCHPKIFEKSGKVTGDKSDDKKINFFNNDVEEEEEFTW